MKKCFAVILVIIMLLSLSACGEKTSGGSGGNSGGTVSAVAGDVCTADIPGGWCFVSGSDMNGANSADFICHAKEYKLGDAYLQVEAYGTGIDDAKAVLESATPYGAYSGEADMDNGTWYIAENAAAALIGEKTMLVRGYRCNFNSDEVQAILGSLAWVK